MKNRYNYISPYSLVAVALLACLTTLISSPAIAQDAYTCNDTLTLTYSDGIITPVIKEIQAIVDGAAEKLFNGIMASSFPNIIAAAITLYIAIMGLMFTMGMIQMSAGEVFKRVLKLAILGVLLQNGWTFFEQYGYKLFREGTDEIIGYMTSTMASSVLPGDYAVSSLNTSEIPGPFEPIDAVLQDFFTPQTFTIFQAASASGPYGFIFLLVFGLSTIYLLGGIARALWVYLVSILAMSLLMGLAPIFIGFMLFDRTKHLFDGWLGLCINFSLQPIMMFSFLGFFIVLIRQSMESILGIKVCYAPKTDIASGSPYEIQFWQFAGSDGTPYSVRWGAEGPMCGDKICPQDASWATETFPLDIVDALTVFLLGYVCWNFYNFVIKIAQDLSGSYVNLEQNSPVQQGLNQLSGAMNRGFGAAMSGQDMKGVGEAFMDFGAVGNRGNSLDYGHPTGNNNDSQAAAVLAPRSP